jgi:hypothetical protein
VKSRPRQEERKPGCFRNGFALRIDALSLLQRPLDHQAHEREGYEVQQQSADHLENTEAELQPDRDDDPQYSGYSGGDDQERDSRGRWNRAELQSDPGSDYRTSVELSFRTNVQRAATKRDSDAESDEDQRYCTDQCRRGERIPGTEGARP